jgi:acetyl-CoA carboxylase carboxyltransferase component
VAPDDGQLERLATVIPRNRRRPYKIAEVLTGIFDAGSWFSYAGYGGATVTGLARLDGHPVGVITSDPMRTGALTARGSDAAIRLVDVCETFHLPLVSLTDQPGALIGSIGESEGTIRHAVRATAAIYQATVPAAEVILRRVFGIGGAGMSNRHRLTRRWAWPSADWGSLPVEGGIEAAYRSELDAAEDRAAELERIRSRLDAVRSPILTAQRFGIEELIDPRDTRALLCDWVRDAYALLPELVGPPSHGTRP